jgi:predicted  nucleic acid-binding Zn-ribbon protein
MMAMEYDPVGSTARPQDLDVTVLAFAQWLSEMRSNSKTSLSTMLAEMSIIRNGITSNNTDLTEFKRNTAQVQQQMQSQISDLRDKLADAYTEIANMKKTKTEFEREVHADCQSLNDQLNFKTLEMETLKKAYAQTHQQLQQQIIHMQSEVNEVRMRGDDAFRQSHVTNEQNSSKVGEVEMATQHAGTELKRLRVDHEKAISSLADNMNRWNETLRDLSKEFHDFQKVMNVNHKNLQGSVWEVQANAGLVRPMQPPNGGGLAMVEGGRMESASEMRGHQAPTVPGNISAAQQAMSQQTIRGGQPPGQQGSTAPRRVGSPTVVPQAYAPAPGSSQTGYVVR